MLLSKPELVKLAVTVANEFSLDPALVCAHIDVRTQWNSGFAVSSALSYHLHSSLSPVEVEQRAIQWGLMAIGGEWARQNHIECALPDLLLPEVNLREGCRLFRAISDTHTDPVEKTVHALLAWNRENSRELSAQTLSKLEAYRALIARIPDQPQTFPDADTTLLLTHSQIEGNLLV